MARSPPRWNGCGITETEERNVMNARTITSRLSRDQQDPQHPQSTRGQPFADQYDGITQYSLPQILATWAATTIPMGLLAWAVTPWLGDRLGGPDPFIQALLLCFLAGLLWQLTLVVVLIGREQGGLQWSQVRDALWLRAPRSHRTGRRGGKVWWWTVPFVLLSGVVNAGWIDPAGPLPRDLPTTLEVDHGRLAHYFDGNWGAFALLVAVALLSPVVEELFFRGLLLPRMRTACGKGDVVANGVLFGLYHLHQPWSIPASVIDGIVTQAYPTRRFHSTWMGIITHTVPSFVIIAAVLLLVL
jgi:membrane protease YdiL (CAAX protease family)